jgi:hypothetical protein
MPASSDVEDSYEVVTLGEMNPLDLTGIRPADGTATPSPASGSANV